jgi:hypothetical protein
LNGAVGEISGCTIFFSLKLLSKTCYFVTKAVSLPEIVKDIIMERLNIENIYSEILLLSNDDRDKLPRIGIGEETYITYENKTNEQTE